MAEYTNLTSFEGLKVGDVVNYTSTIAFNSKGYKLKVQLYGKKVSSSNGGLTEFIIDTSLLPEKILSFNSRGDLIYGNTTDLYYRIAVAGDAGGNSSSYNGGVGGGNTGGDGRGGKSLISSDELKGQPGTQTSGGKYTGNPSNIYGVAGGFGTTPSINGNKYCGAGGYGWYSGSTGWYFSTGWGYSYGASGGGGSGFIIGVSTSTYPAGYLGNNAELQRTIASSISNGTLTQGGSSSYTAKMIVTVEAVGGETSTQSVISYYNGNSFVNTTAKYYNGIEFVDCDAFYYNGNEFIKI